MSRSTRIAIGLVLVLCVSALGAEAGQELNLVPKPAQVKRLRGWFEFKPGELGLRLGTRASAGDSFAARLFQDEVQTDLGITLPLGEAKRQIVLAIPQRDSDLVSICRKQKCLPDEQLGDQGYVLVVRPKRIVVAANSSTGLFYGIQTLRQLVRGNSRGAKIPCVRIRDYPALPYRGQQDDLSRGPVRTKEFLKQEIRRMAELKLNMTTYYTEHVFRTKSHPEFAPPGAALTPEDVAELAEYARKYHVTLIGNFQSFGHFRNILKHPKYEPLGESDWVLSPAFRESYDLLADILREVARAYPGRFFNVNCDETWGLGTGASRRMVEEKGIAAVYAQHLNWLHDELAKYGKRMMMWGDIALKYPEIISRLYHDTIMLSWGYGPEDSFVDAIRPFREAGFDVFVCPGVSCWNRLFPDFRTARTNIHNYVRDGVAEGAIGMLNTAWYDDGEGLFSWNWYGIAYGAEQAWNPGPLDDPTFARRFSAAVYGDRENRVGRAIEALSGLHQTGPPDGTTVRTFWRPLLPPRDGKLTLGLEGWDRVERVTKAVRELLQAAKVTHYRADLPYILLAADRIELIPQLRRAVIRAASSYRRACLTELGSEEGARLIREAIAAIGNAETELFAFRQQYQTLWLGENRVWWLERNLEKFDGLLSELTQVRDWLVRAAWDWEKGQPIPAPRDIRLDVEELTGDFFRSWLVCGAFVNPRAGLGKATGVRENCGGLDIDYLELVGGEAEIRPSVGDTVWTPDGQPRVWHLVESEEPWVNLRGRFAPNRYVAAYAYCELELPEAMNATLLVGSNDGVRVYVNGTLVHDNRRPRRLTIDEDVIPVQLGPGVNRILLKIGQCGADWGFAFRIKGLSVSNHEHRYSLTSAK